MLSVGEFEVGRGAEGGFEVVAVVGIGAETEVELGSGAEDARRDEVYMAELSVVMVGWAVYKKQGPRGDRLR